MQIQPSFEKDLNGGLEIDPILNPSYLIVCSWLVFLTVYDTDAQVPTRWYFGREVARCKSRHVLSRYALPQRCYLGPTSMDTEMAFLMCNQAQARTEFLFEY